MIEQRDEVDIKINIARTKTLNNTNSHNNLVLKKSRFPLWTVPLYVATFQKNIYMEHISLSLHDIPELLVPIMISFKVTVNKLRQLLNKGFLLAKLTSSQVLWSPPWFVLTITEYLRHKLPWIWSVCLHHNPVLFSFMIFIARFVKSVTQWVATSG